MEQALLRPPLLRLIPTYVWSVLLWSAALIYAAAICFGRVSYHAPNGQHLARDLTPGEWVALSLLLASPLGMALRRPVAVFCVLLVESAAAVVFTSAPQEWLLILAVSDALLLYVAAVRTRRISILCALLALAAQLLEAQRLSTQGKPSEALFAVPVASMLLAAWSVGNSIRQHRAYGAALRIQAAAQAVTAERLRIARELHDQVAHSIGVIAIQAGAAGLVLDTRPEGARAALAAIESTSRETLAGLRRMLVSLRRAEAGDQSAAEPAAGLDAVPRLVERVAEAGIKVRIDWGGTRRPLPPEVDLAAFRIIQESVTNVVRHCAARECRVHIEFRTGELAIDVLDDGHGEPRDAPADAEATGFGIAGMRERVTLLGGLFSAGPRPEGGFRVTARLPA